jgi:hypothetical protein
MSETKLFLIHSRADLHGYKHVGITWFVDERPQPLFGPAGLLGVDYRDVITDYNEAGDFAALSQAEVEECFTEDEAQAFVAWVRARRNDSTAAIEQVILPRPGNVMPLGSMPVGGGPDFLLVGEADDYGLPFKVIGFYDVRGCAFDETLPNARRAAQGVKLHDGIAEVWLLDEPTAAPF